MHVEKHMTKYEMLIRGKKKLSVILLRGIQNGAGARAAPQYHLSQGFCMTTKALDITVVLISSGN